MGSFTGKVVLVTGPAGNLGKAVVEKFLQEDARMILIDRHPERLLTIFPQLVEQADQVLTPGVDLADPLQVGRAIQDAHSIQGQIDCLVHTAGGFEMGQQVHEISQESWNHLINLNLGTLLNTVRAVIPYMLERRQGKIVTIGARPGLQGKAKMGAYSVAKAGVIRLTESMSAELKGSGINVNCVLPGTIDTPQNRQSMPGADRSGWVSPSALADVIVFLCSENAQAIHGASIPAYGA